MVVLYGNDALSILVLSTKKRYSNFLIKVFVFQEICFKVKVLKTFKISSDCHIKTSQSLKALVSFFRKTYALSVGFSLRFGMNLFNGNSILFHVTAWNNFCFIIYFWNRTERDVSLSEAECSNCYPIKQSG